MNSIFEIKDKAIIYDILDQAEYGTLALSVEYSVCRAYEFCTHI